MINGSLSLHQDFDAIKFAKHVIFLITKICDIIIYLGIYILNRSWRSAPSCIQFVWSMHLWITCFLCTCFPKALLNFFLLWMNEFIYSFQTYSQEMELGLHWILTIEYLPSSHTNYSHTYSTHTLHTLYIHYIRLYTHYICLYTHYIRLIWFLLVYPSLLPIFIFFTII